MENVELGNTYLADRLTEDGNIIESALDHTYLSSYLKSRTSVSKLDSSSTDHLPIIAKIALDLRAKTNTKKTKTLKRSMKNFNHTNWNASLVTKNWEIKKSYLLWQH